MLQLRCQTSDLTALLLSSSRWNQKKRPELELTGRKERVGHVPHLSWKPILLTFIDFIIKVTLSINSFPLCQGVRSEMSGCLGLWLDHACRKLLRKKSGGKEAWDILSQLCPMCLHLVVRLLGTWASWTLFRGDTLACFAWPKENGPSTAWRDSKTRSCSFWEGGTLRIQGTRDGTPIWGWRSGVHSESSSIYSPKAKEGRWTFTGNSSSANYIQSRRLKFVAGMGAVLFFLIPVPFTDSDTRSPWKHLHTSLLNCFHRNSSIQSNWQPKLTITHHLLTLPSLFIRAATICDHRICSTFRYQTV